MKIMCI